MYARLNPNHGWRYKNEDGTWGLFVISDIYRYAGMCAGTTGDGACISRPIIEFDFVSHDGLTWLPIATLIKEIPWRMDV